MVHFQFRRQWRRISSDLGGGWEAFMKVVILQPSYIPWRGYFHQIMKADIFVFYDCVQYDKRGWRNRNKIKARGGSEWLSIPVESRGAQVQCIPIKDIKISWGSEWAAEHLEKIRHAYSRAPFFRNYFPLLQDFYERRDVYLADFTCDLTVALAGELGIRRKQFLRSSSFTLKGTKTDRLIEMLTLLGADHYISGPSAKEYLELDKMEAAGVGVEFMNYNYGPYPQLHGDFESAVSVLDLLFNVGPESSGYIW